MSDVLSLRSEHAVRESEMTALLRRFVREDEGQDLVEYAMLIALIALTVVAAVSGLATAIGGQYNRIATSSPLTAS